MVSVKTATRTVSEVGVSKETTMAVVDVAAVGAEEVVEIVTTGILVAHQSKKGYVTMRFHH